MLEIDSLLRGSLLAVGDSGEPEGISGGGGGASIPGSSRINVISKLFRFTW